MGVNVRQDEAKSLSRAAWSVDEEANILCEVKRISVIMSLA